MGFFAALAKSMYEGTQAIAETAKPANPLGANQHTIKDGGSDNYKTHKNQFGTSAEYLTSVIARDAIEYAIHNQRNRRNLTVAEIVSCLQVLDERKRPQFHGNQHTVGVAPNGARPDTPAKPTETTGLDVAESCLTSPHH